MPVAQLPQVGLHYLQVQRKSDPASVDCGELVLIHGLAANLAFWQSGVAPALAALCRVTSYDMRGHGLSGMTESGYTPQRLAEDLKELLDYLEIERVHLLAHSFGGTVAALFALNYPERIRSLIMADVRLKAIQPRQPLDEWEQWPRWRQRLERAGIRLDDSDDEGGYQLLLELVRWQARQRKGGRPVDGLPAKISGITGGRRAAKRWLDLQERSTFKRDFFAPAPMPQEALRNIRVPMLAVYGEQSQALPTARALKRLCPDCKLRIIPGVGHFFPLTNGRKLVRPARRFLRSQVEGPDRQGS